MSLPRLWAFLAVALPVLASLLATLSTPDLAYQLRAGAEILSTGRVPTTDAWTFTALDAQWFDQQWGAQAALATVFEAGGWTGLVVLRAVLVGVTFGALFLAARRRGTSRRVAAWLTLGAFIVAVAGLGLRPQLFGLALFAITLLLVADRRAHPGRLWAIPILAIVWANVHGSFFFAPLVLGLVWLEDLAQGARPRHRALVVALAATAATAVTPFGAAVWTYALGLSTNRVVIDLITEWQRTSLGTVDGALFYGSALVIALVVARRGVRVPWPTLVWLAVFFAFGAYAARGIVWWSVAAVIPVAGIVASRVRDDADPVSGPAERPTPRAMARVNVAIAGAIVVACIALLPIWRPIDRDLEVPARTLSLAPSGITGALRDLARPGDRVLNPQPWGSWFEFAVPDALYAVDSRIEIFTAAVWDDYVTVQGGGSGWESVIDRWAVSIVVTDGTADGLAGRLRGIGWVEHFRDADGAILVRPDR